MIDKQVAPKRRALPKSANAVPVEKGFTRYEDEISGLRLGDEHPVKRVAMGTRQRAGARSVFDGDGQFLEVLSSYCPGNVEGQRLRVREFADPMFGGDLPGRRRADHYVVAVILNRLPRR